MIAGHYRLVEHIGSGAMGVVWRAIDVRLERSVAVKQILAQPGVSEAERDNMRQRAMREAKNAARFQHPNAIVVFDIAEHGGDPCLVMEFVDGPSLSAVLAQNPTLPVGQVARIGEQVASALLAAHRAGIVHRDVKPGNILIDGNGVAKLTDFGISRAAGDMALTQTGLIGGTPAYLAPELARGADPVPSSDVFALGATLYQALEGLTPYGDTSNQLALLYAAANGNIVPPKQAGPATSLVMSLLQPEPDDRPSMAEARDQLARLASRSTEQLPGITVSPTLPSGGAGGRRPVAAENGAPPPWQRNTPQGPPAPQGPQTPPRTPTAAYAPPMTPPRPTQAMPPQTPPRPVPSAAAPMRAPQPPNSDSKRKTLLFAGAGAAVVVIAVIVFLVLNSGSDGNDSGGTASGPGSSSSQQPGKSSPKSPSSSGTPAGAPGTTPTESKVTDFGSAAKAMTTFIDDSTRGSAAAWNLLTPAAQKVYGTQQQFQQYWADPAQKIGSWNTVRSDLGKPNDDGSLTMNVNINSAPRYGWRLINLGGSVKIDSDTRLSPGSPQG
ncbi:serine/threonine-protein kinase [Amycolatopsis xylanica]|uniref:serine/threonine-protein kinase n=1 Tax=Amycolatopsis xylanica TaxID=589385 RepID=UPI001C40B602|nr:serine/threonine-protein kinase [Amycolatopsis xylanica]